jgi:peptide chain release factor 1
MTHISSERIASIEAKKQELADAMARGDVAPEEFVRLSKDYAAIEPVAAAAREVRRLRAELEVLTGMLHDPASEPELKEMAAAEAEEIKHKLPQAERALAIRLLPRDAADDRAAMLEVRAGTGGDEAALFAGDLYRMLTRYAERRGFTNEALSLNPAGVGGFKEIVLEIKGDGAYSVFKHEAGVHRVQRVPKTESQGRIHTSTATVAVLPEAEEVEVEVDPSTRPIRRCASRTSRLASSSRCRTRNRSSRTASARCGCFAPDSTSERSWSSRRSSPQIAAPRSVAASVPRRCAHTTSRRGGSRIIA